MAIALVKSTTTTWPNNTGNTNASPGPVSVVPGNTKGNLLVLMAAWEQGPRQKGVYLPAGAVADSAGNWWRYAGDTDLSVSQPATGVWGTRVGIWICSNALAIPTWLSFCPQGYVEGYAYGVYEFSGLPASYWPVIDFHVGAAKTTNTPNDTLVLNATASQADLYLSMGGANGHTGSVFPSPSGGWTALGNIGFYSSGDDGQGIFSQGAWQVGGGAGAATVTWTYSNFTPGAVAALMVGITQQSYLPQQPQAFFPKVIVEAALGATPGNPAQAILDDEWTDMSQYALGKGGEVGISSSRGQQYELATPESGQMVVAMNNQAGDFNPLNPGARFYSTALNANPSFQTGIWSWTPKANAVLAPATSPVFASVAGAVSKGSLQITPDGVTASPGATSEQVPVNPNREYSASAWLNCPLGWATGLQAQIVWFTSSHTLISTSSGSLVPLVAGIWTQVTVSVPTPPTNAAFAAVQVAYGGTPGATVVTYAEESGISPGTALLTGTLRLGVPVRTSCFWNGQRYPVGYGNVERWPQEWPDFPQWGWSVLIATDNVGVATSAVLPSAVQGEILADVPYACFPFSEQYSVSTASLNGVVKSPGSADGLIAANTARGNPRTATYTDGVVPAVTGQQVAMAGDSGTGFGAAGYSGVSTPTTFFRHGPGAVYGPDSAMPLVKSAWDLTVPFATLEFVFTLPVTPTSSGLDRFLTLFTVGVRPNVKSAGTTATVLGPGVYLAGGVDIVSGTTTYQFWLQTGISGVSPTVSGVVLQPGTTHHAVILLANGTASLIIDGSSDIGVGCIDQQQLTSLTFGGIAYPLGQSGQFVQANFDMAYGTLYPYQTTHAEWNRHLNAITLGFQGDPMMSRTFRYMAWAALNLGLAGPSEYYTSLGPAYSAAGSTLSSAVNSDALSTGARWGAIANGNVVMLDRTTQYNRSPVLSFGDNPVGYLNPNPGFEYGTTGWVGGNGASIATVSSPVYSGLLAMRITPDGITANPRLYANGGAKIPTTALAQYAAWAWMQSPGGYASGAVVKVDWYSGITFLSTSISPVAQLLAGAWTPVVLQATAPATADGAVWHIQMQGTPSAANTLIVDMYPVRPAADPVPYLPQMAMDYDNTYLVNATQATLASGPNTLGTPVYRDQASAGLYYSRGPASQQVSGTDMEHATDFATWNLSKYKNPAMRIRQIVISPASRPQSFDSVLQLDVGDAAFAERSPLGGVPYNMPVITQRVQHEIGPGKWLVSYQESPYTIDSAILVTDTTGYDVVGQNNLAW